MNKKMREWLESIILAALIAAVLFVVLWPFVISGDSMEDSFFDRDRIAISRLLATVATISQGDFIVCKLEGSSDYVLKRVIGVPGDTLEIVGGNVYINGSLLNEYYLSQPYTPGEVNLTLMHDEYFVLGDNRAYSYDSRNAGPVRASSVVGKVVLRWYPFDRITAYVAN